MSAAERLTALDGLPATVLCERTEAALAAFVSAMNEETTLLRAGRFRDSAPVTAEKSRLAQDYVGLARSVQRQAKRLALEAPHALSSLRSGHDRLTTQMAENLRVIATARTVTEDILTDVSRTVGQQNRTKTYGAGGAQPARTAPEGARGLTLNRAL